MKLRLVIFDDSQSSGALLPLSEMRSIDSLRRGCFTQRERIVRAFADCADFFASMSMEDLQLDSGDWLLVNASLLCNSETLSMVKSLQVGQSLFEDESKRVIALRVQIAEKGAFSWQKVVHHSQKCQLSLYKHWWELVAGNGEQIDQDFQDYYSQEDSFSVPSQFTTLLNPYSIWLGKNVDLNVGAVLDARAGAIVIEDGVQVGSNALIQGPCFVGKGAIVKPFADLKNGATIGGRCKVGGEVDGAIIDDFSNKQHYGFIGESYIGSWVNLGAGSTCSDLKNNYSIVKSYSDGNIPLDTGRQFLGCVVGDYTRLGIGSLINTGAYIGAGCALYGSDVISGKICNFRFGKAGDQSLYDLPKFMQTLQVVKARRGLSITPAEQKTIGEIYNKELVNYGSKS